MSKTATIKLGEMEYTIRRFNAGELRKLTTVFANGQAETRALEILALAMQRAEPKVEDFWVLEFPMSDVAPALETLRVLCGLEIKNPPEAAASSTQPSN